MYLRTSRPGTCHGKRRFERRIDDRTTDGIAGADDAGVAVSVRGLSSGGPFSARCKPCRSWIDA